MKAPFSERLNVKIIVLVTALMTVLLGSAHVYTSNQHKKALLDAERHTSEHFHRFIMRSLILAMTTGKQDRVQEFFQSGLLLNNNEFAHFVSPDGTVLFSSQLGLSGNSLGNKKLIEMMREATVKSKRIEVETASGLTMALPVLNDENCVTCHVDNGEIMGFLVIRHDFQGLREMLANVIQKDVLFVVASVSVVVIALFVLIKLVVLTPLFNVARGAESLVHGKFDEKIDVAGNDEISKLADHLVKLQSQLKQNNEIARSVAENLSLAVHELDSFCEEMVETVMDQSSGAAQQASTVQEVTSTAQEVAATSAEISSNVSSVNKIAESTYEACVRGRTDVRNAVSGMGVVKDKVRMIADAIVGLGRTTQKIGGVVSIIDEISEQTHLLALNAAIEAAGAGEHGKRFAVVAAEVRRLSERTVEATAEIRSLINEIIESTNDTVMTTEKGSAIVIEGASRVDQVGTSLEEISNLVLQTKESAKEIEVATKQQAMAGEQLVMTISDINAVALQVSRSAEVTEKSVSRLQTLAKNLKKLAHENRDASGFSG